MSEIVSGPGRSRRDASLSALWLVVAFTACSPAPSTFRVTPPLGLDEFFSVPEDNALTRAKVELGRRLFFDTILSADGARSCASCHRPERAFADTVAFSVGVYDRRARRNTPSLLNAAYRSSFSWDGRESSLEAQVLRPFLDTLELALPLEGLVGRLRADRVYRRTFRSAFGADPSGPLVGLALASFVRTLRSGDAPLDRHRAGEMPSLAADARRGLDLFLGKANCTACHLGPLFTDESFHNTGVSWGGVDGGRTQVTNSGEDRGRFRTPSLRNVACTAPYMHDGSIAALSDVVDFYDRVAGRNPSLDPDLSPLGLSPEEKSALVAFLRTLGSEGC